MKITNELSVLHELSKAVISVNRPEDVYQRILKIVADVFGVAKASIMKLDPEDRELKIVASVGLPAAVAASARVKIGEGISGSVFKSNKPVLIKNIKASRFESKKRYKSNSLMSAPVRCFAMSVGGRPVGVINVTDRKSSKAFTPADLKLLTTIANQTAAFIHLCDLGEMAARAEKLRNELELARNIQQRLLPRKQVHVEGLDIAGKCITAERVGGDYFDVISGGVRPLSIVVADVAGHSVSAAMMMAALRSAVHAGGASCIFSPAIATERLNRILFDDLAGAERFVSLCYAQLVRSVAKGCSLKYTTAGHYAPLVLSKGEFFGEASNDPLLGIDKKAVFHERKVELKEKDVVVFFTDGLVEARNKKGDTFGISRLKNIVKNNRNFPAEEMVEILCGEVRSFTGKADLVDDVTVVILKVVK